MGQHSTSESPRRRIRGVLAAAFAAGTLAITGAGVYAGLNAEATGTESVASGTLSLTLSAESGSTGFPQTISNMAPGDVVNTYVDLTNGTGLAGKDVTLGVVGSPSTLLTSDATKGLHVTVTECSQAWTVASGACGGTTTSRLADGAVSTLSTPASLISGAIATSAVYHLQVSVRLPGQTETTTNGTTIAGTIQGLSTTLTYTFNEVQRDATTSNV